MRKTDDRGYQPLQMADWREVPSQVLERQEVREEIASALDQLPPHYREVFFLRDVEGLSILETASVLGISAVLVKVRLLRARLRLRDILAPQLRLDAAAQRKKGG